MLERGDRTYAGGGRSAVAAHKNRLDSGGTGTGDILLEAVADVDRVLGAGADERQRLLEDRRRGLARADFRRGEDPVEQRLELQRAQDTVQRHVPIAHHDEPLAARARGAECGPDVGERVEPQRREQRVDERVEVEAVGRERRAQHLRAPAAERLEARRVAPLVEMGAVVGDLGGDRALGFGRAQDRIRIGRPARAVGAGQAAGGRQACRARRAGSLEIRWRRAAWWRRVWHCGVQEPLPAARKSLLATLDPPFSVRTLRCANRQRSRLPAPP